MKIVVIAGPTAVGKSETAIDLAKRIGGEIISADSMQIYRGMNVGTAKLARADMRGVAHHIIDLKDPDEPFTVADFKELAQKKISEINARGNVAIIVGGTGLYIDALIFDFDFAEASPDERLRRYYYDYCEKNGAEKLYALLKEKSPETASRIHPNNVKRVIRSLEIVRNGAKKPQKTPKSDVILTVLSLERSLLYQRIDARVDKMFETGLQREVGKLIAEGFGFDLQSMQAIGYKEFKGLYDGECDLDFVRDLIKKNTRHYAKRQICWFKRYKNAVWFDGARSCDLIDYVEKNLE